MGNVKVRQTGYRNFTNQRSKMSKVFVVLCLIICAPVALAARGRPHLDTSLGYKMLLTDNDTLLRGVSLSWDGGDPYGSQVKVMPSQAALNALATDCGLNAVHLYLEGDSSGNTNPVGYNAADCDTLVQRCANAGLYLIITIGCNGENGTIHSMSWSLDFWNFYGPRYKDKTHVIYEAHNEPVPWTLYSWNDSDWNNQLTFYNTIRAAAPETFILLGSFMGFVGDPRYGANYLSARGVSWSNAGFAHHGYESLAGIESAISLMQTSTSYPALLCTEFWPGDTAGQGYNSMYESHFNGWMQFQWLGASNADLLDFKSKITAAGTVWTPDLATCNWPAKGALNIPPNGSGVGIFSRGGGMFLSADPANSNNLKADLADYTATQNDAFIIERTGPRLVSLKAANGLYVRTTGATDSLTALWASASKMEKYEWLRRANGDIVLRAYGGGGHLIKINAANGYIYPNADNEYEAATNFVTVDTPGSPPPPLTGNPYYGTPLILPGVVQAEDFDLGGEGVAYHDNNAGNNGGRYRTAEDVDIENCSEGGFNVGWIETGEWIEYTVDVATVRGDYDLDVRVATRNAGGAFRIEFKGIDQTGSITVPNTGGWQNWTTVSTTVTLDPGVQIMRFVRSPGADYNLNKFTFSYIGGNGDMDLDGDIDSLDFALFAQYWQQTSCGNCGGADLTGDGNVWIYDLKWFCDNWMAGI